MPPFRLEFTNEAEAVLSDLSASAQYQKKLDKVRRTLGRIQRNPRHPGLNSHECDSIDGLAGEEVWEGYVEDRTPSAWRVFWHYGPAQGVITIVTIGTHP